MEFEVLHFYLLYEQKGGVHCVRACFLIYLRRMLTMDACVIILHFYILIYSVCSITNYVLFNDTTWLYRCECRETESERPSPS